VPRNASAHAMAALAVVVAVALGPRAARAGDWHRDESLVCGDCHTMHNSAGGAAMRYDDTAPSSAASLLLRAANVNALCTHCHDGSRSDAPDVMGEKSVAYEAVDPAAGAFPNTIGVASDSSHDLGLPAPVTPPDGDTPIDMSCTSCHDPHGNTNYRNLRSSPSGTNRSPPLEVKVASTIAPDGRNPIDAYATSNLKYASGMTRWCLDCHNLYDQSAFHASDVAIQGSFFADYDWWATQPIANRVRVENPLDNPPLVPSADDRVFCLSCHKAHGSPIKAGQIPASRALIYADGETLDSTCIQCHDK
jgi:predicted CXXCH cytochrome family protein